MEKFTSILLTLVIVVSLFLTIFFSQLAPTLTNKGTEVDQQISGTNISN